MQVLPEQIALHPIGDRLVVQPIVAAEKTAGGVFLADPSRERPQEAKVIAVGPGRRYPNGQQYPVECRVGDRVLITKFQGEPFRLGHVDGPIVWVTREEHVLAIVTVAA